MENPLKKIIATIELELGTNPNDLTRVLDTHLSTIQNWHNDGPRERPMKVELLTLVKLALLLGDDFEKGWQRIGGMLAELCPSESRWIGKWAAARREDQQSVSSPAADRQSTPRASRRSQAEPTKRPPVR